MNRRKRQGYVPTDSLDFSDVSDMIDYGIFLQRISQLKVGNDSFAMVPFIPGRSSPESGEYNSAQSLV